MKKTKNPILLRPLCMGKLYKIDYSEYKCAKAVFKGMLKTANGLILFIFQPQGWKCKLFLTEAELKLVVAELED